MRIDSVRGSQAIFFDKFKGVVVNIKRSIRHGAFFGFLTNFIYLPLHAENTLVEVEIDVVNKALSSHDMQEEPRGDLEEITVTGSRIKKTDFTSPAPIEIISVDKTALAGLLSSTDVLQGSTLASGQQLDDSFSAYVTDGGPGANQISLRSLGGQRSLVLVNGKRWTPSGIGGAVYAVDLTAIPDTIVNRYEILKDGASSLYGADAVAGVVNVITRTAFDGGTVSMSLERPELSTGGEVSFDAFWGKTGGNWTFSIGGNIKSRNALTQSQLDYAQCDTRPRLTDQDGDGNVDNKHPDTGEDLCFGFVYGFVISPFGWARYDPSLAEPDATNENYDAEINGEYGIPLYTRVPATPYDNSGEYYLDELSPGINDVESERHLFSLNSFGTYDFAMAERSATAYYEFYYNRRQTSARSGYRQIFPTVGVDNPYNPFGLFGAGEALGDSLEPVIPVVPTYGIEDPTHTVDIARSQIFVGLRGDLTASWTYDMYLGAGNSEGHYHQQSLLDDRLMASLDAEMDPSGEVVCRDRENFPGCVAVNLFSESALLRGVIADDARDFLIKDIHGKTVYDGVTISGYATGELGSLPAGAVSAVIGGEYRSESINDQPDANSVKDNLFGRSAAGVSKGRDKVRELYTEIEAPLLMGRLGFEELTVNLSGRYTDYDSYGSDTTYRVAVDWRLTRSLRLRATQGTSFRAPDLYEQFLGDQTGFTEGFYDPCKTYLEFADPGDFLYDNCVAQNLPDDYFDSTEGIKTITGGADTLSAETSESSTYGFVYQPEGLGVAVSVNWWDIKIENTVSSLSPLAILDLCYGSFNLSSPFCTRIGPRESNGSISYVDGSFINIGQQRVSGYDIDVLYEKSFALFQLAIDLNVTYSDENREDLLDDVFDYEGRLAEPFWNGETDVRLGWREWTFNWRMEWIGKTRENPVFDPGTRNVDRITSTGDEYFHTLSARYEGASVRVLGAVRNVFDKDPPMVADGSGSLTSSRVFNTIPGAGYPLLGRTFVVQVSFDF